jgi:hypothetical protein
VVLTELLGQFVHVVAAEAPVAVEYLPAMQFVHVLAAEAPVAVEYVPAMQFVHVAATEAPVAVEYVPAMQLVHTSLPVPNLYVPALQIWQTKFMFQFRAKPSFTPTPSDVKIIFKTPRVDLIAPGSKESPETRNMGFGSGEHEASPHAYIVT